MPIVRVLPRREAIRAFVINDRNRLSFIGWPSSIFIPATVSYAGGHGQWYGPTRFDQLNPVTGTAAPWIACADSDARNAITRARSIGATHFDGSALGIAARFSGVSMTVGQDAVHVDVAARATPPPWLR